MRAGLVCALMMCVVSATAAAQDGLRSASLSERRPGPTVATERDLFVVAPDFYNRPPSPDAQQLFFPNFLSLPPGVPGWLSTAPVWQYPQSPYPPPPPHVNGRAQDVARDQGRVPIASPADTVPLPAMPIAPMVPGRPKTFYVIPGCYAGDRPPASDWLPSGCDTSKLRIIPPE